MHVLQQIRPGCINIIEANSDELEQINNDVHKNINASKYGNITLFLSGWQWVLERILHIYLH